MLSWPRRRRIRVPQTSGITGGMPGEARRVSRRLRRAGRRLAALHLLVGLVPSHRGAGRVGGGARGDPPVRPALDGRGPPRSIFSSGWFRAIVVLGALAVGLVVTLPYVLRWMDPAPRMSARAVGA